MKAYIIPTITIVRVHSVGHLLIDSAGSHSMSVDATQEVNTNMVKGNSSSGYNVWNDDWNQ